MSEQQSREKTLEFAEEQPSRSEFPFNLETTVLNKPKTFAISKVEQLKNIMVLHFERPPDEHKTGTGSISMVAMSFPYEHAKNGDEVVNVEWVLGDSSYKEESQWGAFVAEDFEKRNGEIWKALWITFINMKEQMSAEVFEKTLEQMLKFVAYPVSLSVPSLLLLHSLPACLENNWTAWQSLLHHSPTPTHTQNTSREGESGKRQLFHKLLYAKKQCFACCLHVPIVSSPFKAMYTATQRTCEWENLGEARVGHLTSIPQKTAFPQAPNRLFSVMKILYI